MKTEAIATLRHLRMGPRKVRLLADLIRGKQVTVAKTQLLFSSKQAAKPLVKLLDSAVANAVHNHGVDAATLLVKTITVNDGPVLKRWMPRAMGRATPIRKRSAHITIVVEGEQITKKQQKQQETLDAAQEALTAAVKTTKTKRAPRAKKASTSA